MISLAMLMVMTMVNSYGVEDLVRLRRSLARLWTLCGMPAMAIARSLSTMAAQM